MNRKIFYIVLTVAAVLASCSKKDEDSKDGEYTVSGTIVSIGGWNKVIASYDLGNSEAATADLTANKLVGNDFKIALPAPDGILMKQLQSVKYFEELLSAKDVKVCTVSFYAGKDDSKEPLGLIEGDFSNGAYSTVQYMYLDKEVKIEREPFSEKMMIDGEEWTVESTFNMDIKKEWNILVTTITTSTSNKSITTATKVSSSVPSKAVWLVIDTEKMSMMKGITGVTF